MTGQQGGIKSQPSSPNSWELWCAIAVHSLCGFSWSFHQNCMTAWLLPLPNSASFPPFRRCWCQGHLLINALYPNFPLSVCFLRNSAWDTCHIRNSLHPKEYGPITGNMGQLFVMLQKRCIYWRPLLFLSNIWFYDSKFCTVEIIQLIYFMYRVFYRWYILSHSSLIKTRWYTENISPILQKKLRIENII